MLTTYMCVGYRPVGYQHMNKNTVTRLRMLGWRIVGLIRRGRLEREMDDEIQSHLAMQAEENERRGMAAEDARLAARRSFGNVDGVKEQHRDKHRLRIIDQLFQDTRHAMRSLLRRPGHTLTAALCLAVGLTVSIVIFSVLISFFWRPAWRLGAPPIIWQIFSSRYRFRTRQCGSFFAFRLPRL